MLRIVLGRKRRHRICKIQQTKFEFQIRNDLDSMTNIIFQFDNFKKNTVNVLIRYTLFGIIPSSLINLIRVASLKFRY